MDSVVWMIAESSGSVATRFRRSTNSNDDSNRFVAILFADENLQKPFVFRAFEMAVLQLLRVDGNRRSGTGVQAGLEGCHQLGEPRIVWNGLIENQN
jgi:hypothetical protein